MQIQVINIEEKFGKFTDHWSPRIIGGLNGQHVKIAKVEGEFVWHHHEQEDELFWVIRGQLTLELRDQTLVLNPGEMCIIPKGVEHKPSAETECWILMFEPESTLNTGSERNEKTVDDLEYI